MFPNKRPIRARRSLTILTLILALSAAACVSTKSRADQAYQNGDFKNALNLYEASFKEGEHDPESYYRAAQACLRLGAFQSAERYYSMSLRYGGGLKVKRALAQYYIQTSNFARAVVILRHLLEIEKNPIPIYNNLGTALMYAGKPLDAEAFLMLAQQKAPGDPLPYVNLGVLYDRHLRNPTLAASFYRCYLKLASPKHAQKRKVSIRLADIEKVYPSSKKAKFACGKPYTQASQPHELVSLRGQLKNPKTAKTVIDLGISPDKDSKKDSKKGPTIEVGVDPKEKVDTSKSLGEPQKPDATRSEKETTPSQRRQLAAEALAKNKPKQVISLLAPISSEDYTDADRRLLSKAYAQQGDHLLAAAWLDKVSKSTPQDKHQLLLWYIAAGDSAKVKSICSTYANIDGHQKVSNTCQQLRENDGSNSKP